MKNIINCWLNLAITYKEIAKKSKSIDEYTQAMNGMKRCIQKANRLLQ